jgi:tRNA-2-methylthio-N6-dimethylallyladenosine synthase
MNPKKVHIDSYGCQMNKLDTSLVTSALKEAGFALTESLRAADVVLINTCSVRRHAEQRVLSHLGHLKHIKQSRPELVVGIIGCMAQRLGSKLLEHEAVNIVCGPAQIPKIADLVNQALQDRHKALAVTREILHKPDRDDSRALEQFESVRDSDDRRIPGQAFVRVMRGCNNFCTYCIVPYVRGPEVCRPPQAIIEQIRRLADAGTKQVTLLGQAVNAYRHTCGDRTYCLADLLEMAANTHGIEWVKFVTSYPAEQFFDEILRVMADSPKVCPYLHMPAQSGSDRILRAMNRHYTAASYLDLLDISIAGDFIVGFPGETEDDFQATVRLLKNARYKNSFIFRYSPRPGTTADKRLTDTVPPDVKQRRNTDLLAAQQQISDQLSRRFLGKNLTVLVEGPSKKARRNIADGRLQLVGRTEGDWIVVFNAPQSLAGQFVNARITGVSPLTLFGQLA